MNTQQRQIMFNFIRSFYFLVLLAHLLMWIHSFLPCRGSLPLAIVGDPTQDESREIIQHWADKVIKFSSEYGGGWAASQIVGAPNVYPRYGDYSGTWAQNRSSLDDAQFIEVGFPEALFLAEVEIYETYHAGGVTRVSARMPRNHWELVYNTSTVSVIRESRNFSIPVPSLSCKADALRIEIDCTVSRSYVEIDAVQIHGHKYMYGPDVDCVEGKWGQCCGQRCGSCSNKMQCDKVTGVCPKIGDSYRCAAGYKGDKCIEPCSGGLYGIGCNETCGACNGSSCNHETGYCPSCEAGWHDKLCKKACPDGLYGVGCNETCGACNGSSCNHQNGYCQSCEAGWRDKLCKKECIKGTWGNGCMNACSIFCKLGLTECDLANGSCSGGCVAGFSGDLCLTQYSPEFRTAAVIGVVVTVVVVAVSTAIAIIFIVFCHRYFGSIRCTEEAET